METLSLVTCPPVQNHISPAAASLLLPALIPTSWSSRQMNGECRSFAFSILKTLKERKKDENLVVLEFNLWGRFDLYMF